VLLLGGFGVQSNLVRGCPILERTLHVVRYRGKHGKAKIQLRGTARLSETHLKCNLNRYVRRC
jgi:hypothetical protein